MGKLHCKQVALRHSVEMAAMYQAGIKICEICKHFPKYSTATIYRHCKKEIGETLTGDKRKFNRGRPSKLSHQDRRAILRAVPKLRETIGSFTSPRIALEVGLSANVSNRTIRRVLQSNGYKYCRSRKKGLLKAADLKARLSFCNEIKRRKLGTEFWKNQISFYLDGKGFQYKRNPLDQARAPKCREWRKPCEGLQYGCTAKGQKEGVTNCNFMVGISFNRGVVLCEQYFGPITAEKMTAIVKKSFSDAFDNSVNPEIKRFLMDGCPRQNARKVMKAYDEIGAMVFKIPPRSPDLNPIENFFGMVVRELNKQAISENISNETKEEFATRAKDLMLSFPSEKIDKLITSMNKRIQMVIKSKGARIKY